MPTDLSHLDGVHGELPVALPGDGDVGEVAGVVGGVRAAQQDLPAQRRGRVAGQVETESKYVNIKVDNN